MDVVCAAAIPREKMLSCLTGVQTNISALCWLWCWTPSTQNSLCVNHKHATRSPSGETADLRMAAAPWPELRAVCRSQQCFCVCYPTVCTCSCQAFLSCDINHTCAYARFSVCVYLRASTQHWSWQHSWVANIIHTRVLTCPHLTKRPLYIYIFSVWKKIGLYKSDIMWGTQRVQSWAELYLVHKIRRSADFSVKDQTFLCPPVASFFIRKGKKFSSCRKRHNSSIFTSFLSRFVTYRCEVWNGNSLFWVHKTHLFI